MSTWRTLTIIVIAVLCASAKMGAEVAEKNVKLTKPCRGTRHHPAPVNSPVMVEWIVSDAEDRLRVVQVYHGGNSTPIFPEKDPHQESENGVRIKLGPGTYEIKVWIPETNINVSTWVAVLSQPQPKGCA
jgi:hypothetical protein